MSQLSQTGTYNEELLVEGRKSRNKRTDLESDKSRCKTKRKKKGKKGEMKLVGEVRKKKDKKEVTCYHC
jgi:hypothetical protein